MDSNCMFFDAVIASPVGFLGLSAQADALFHVLKYPPSILESIETFAENPEGWVTPILTEPFEEGVEQAIGGKKKK